MQFGQVEVASFLIEQGYSDPSHAAHNGSTPCMLYCLWTCTRFACGCFACGCLVVIELALTARCALLVHYAAASGQLDCVEYIISCIPPEEVDALNRDGGEGKGMILPSCNPSCHPLGRF